MSVDSDINTFLDLCQLSSPDLGPVCHDREDAGTVSGPRALLLVPASQTLSVRSSFNQSAPSEFSSLRTQNFTSISRLCFSCYFCIQDHNLATATIYARVHVSFSLPFMCYIYSSYRPEACLYHPDASTFVFSLLHSCVVVSASPDVRNVMFLLYASMDL